MARTFFLHTLMTETMRDELSSSELTGGADCGYFHDAGGILVVFAGAVCQAVDERDGLRPERQRQDRGDEEVRRAGLCGLAGGEPDFRFCTRAVSPLDASRGCACWGDDWLSRLAG